jgi:hypothetical protein
MVILSRNQTTHIMGKKAKKLQNRAKFSNKSEEAETTKVAPTPAQPVALAAKTTAAPTTKKKEAIQATETSERGVGYVVEIASDNSKVLYWKVVTLHPVNDEYVTALAYKPGIPAVVGAKIHMDLVPHFNKWSATNVAIIAETSEITPYVEQMDIQNEVAETDSGKSLFPSQVAGLLLKTPQRTGNLCQDLGFKQILGRVHGGSKLQFA